jgi:cytidine deaminase
MNEIKKESVLTVHQTMDELPVDDKKLLQQAKQAISTSYAPYSKFYVGCAVLLENGETILGSNQENIAYPSGLCAERVAIFYAGATYPNIPIKTIAISVKAENFEVNEPIMSCGACLQSISEYELKSNQPIRFVLQGETGAIYTAESVRTFMPFLFWNEQLK